uniref:Glycosyltransferase N-terminal domain-containing protein n=1 Tax=Oryza rufipogon TaxID=4529 RepID=A0A0E0NBF2_ORYRU
MAPTPDSVSATSPPPPLPPPHFVIVPFPAQGHTIPMVDLARLLAERGARASLVVTPVNAAHLRGVADHAARAKLPLEIVEVSFSPSAADAGLPPGVENVDQITDYAHFRPFFDVMRHLAAPLEAYLRALPVPPSCVISDWSNPWTAGVASRVGVPRLFFHGPSCFYSLCDLNAAAHGLQQQGDDDRILQLTMEAMRTADGAVVNTFKDLEDEFIACYEAALGKPVWTLGPFCLYNRDADAMASRGNTLDVAQSAITTWLDGMDTDSVTYVNFGSLACKVPKYLFEVGHGLEDSGKPFICVVKESEVATPEVQEWLSALEARVAGRGVVVRGWAPQLAILSHRAVGGFVTHCSWNSILESIAHGTSGSSIPPTAVLPLARPRLHSPLLRRLHGPLLLLRPGSLRHHLRRHPLRLPPLARHHLRHDRRRRQLRCRAHAAIVLHVVEVLHGHGAGVHGHHDHGVHAAVSVKLHVIEVLHGHGATSTSSLAPASAADSPRPPPVLAVRTAREREDREGRAEEEHDRWVPPFFIK